MRARVIVTDDTGAVFEGEVELVPSTEGGVEESAAAKRRVAKAPRVVSARSDFSKPARAFMHLHGRNRSGHEAFALLMAWMTKGETGKEVRVEDLRREWDRMRGVLGGFATIYATRAKDNAWVDSPERGVFVLLPDWEELLKRD